MKRACAVGVGVLAGATAASCPPGEVFGVLSNAQFLGFGVDVRSVAVGDLDGDGRDDVVTFDFDNGEVSVLLSTGGLPLLEDVYPSEDALAGGLADLDGDGDLDIAAINLGSAAFIRAFLNDGGGAFSPALASPCGANRTDVALGDLDGDGRPDAVTVSQTANELEVRFGTGSGTFVPGPTYAVGTGPSRVVLADLDGDGTLDAVTANSTDDSVSVLLNTGVGGVFEPPVAYGLGSSPRDIAVGDTSGDGLPDILVADLNNGAVIELRNLSDATPGLFGFGDFVSIPDGVWSVDALDANYDGVADLAIGGTFGITSLIVSDPTSTDPGGALDSAVVVPIDTKQSNHRAVFGDFNGDLAIDVFAFRAFNESYRVVLGECGPPLPEILAQPENVVADTSVPFAAFSVSDVGADTYQWRFNGVPLTDGPLVVGSSSSTLVLTTALENVGTLDVVLTNDAGTVTSDEAVFAITNACPSDVNLDGATDLSDLLTVLANFGSTCPPAPPLP